MTEPKSNRIEEIRERLHKQTRSCLCGLAFCTLCESDEDFDDNAIPDMSHLLTQLDRCKKALEFYGAWHTNEFGDRARTTIKEVWGE